MKVGGQRAEGTSSQGGHLARRRLQCDTTVGSRATLAELD